MDAADILVRADIVGAALRSRITIQVNDQPGDGQPGVNRWRVPRQAVIVQQKRVLQDGIAAGDRIGGVPEEIGICGKGQTGRM